MVGIVSTLHADHEGTGISQRSDPHDGNPSGRATGVGHNPDARPPGQINHSVRLLGVWRRQPGKHERQGATPAKASSDDSADHQPFMVKLWVCQTLNATLSQVFTVANLCILF